VFIQVIRLGLNNDPVLAVIMRRDSANEMQYH
jgi:hypothetical protein